MIPMLKQFFHDLLWSPERATLWIRGSIMLVSQVLAVLTTRSDLPVPPEWAPWISTIGLVIAVLVKAGEKNK